MFKEITGKLWKNIPRWARLRIIRTTQNTFTASAGALVTNRSEEILLLDHVLRPKSGWGIPGGFMNHGEQPEQTVSREIMEEVGLELSNIKMIRVRTSGRHIEILFSAEAEGEPKVLSREIKSAGWFAVNEIPAEMNPAEKFIIENYLKSEL
ncbi:MAG: NUDIX hydrolase [Pyrinomonadaceae bacterium]